MTVAFAPCALAMPSAIWRRPDWASSRARGEVARIVPSSSALSGITLPVVPAAIFVTLITTGSNASIRRVTKLDSAVTISHATGIGSSASCGIEAWPPRPVSAI